MVACPDWDTAFVAAIQSVDTTLALFFSTLFQPYGDKNTRGLLLQDCGTAPSNFSMEKLLALHHQSTSQDIEGYSLQPTLVYRQWWHALGGYSMEFSPGMSSDDDLLMKFWVAGCRHFRIVGASHFYHFSCKSTGRIQRNRGGREFLLKWGISQKDFYKNYLLQLNDPASPAHSLDNTAQLFPRATIKTRIKRALYSLFFRHPLKDLQAWDPAPAQDNQEHKRPKKS